MKSDKLVNTIILSQTIDESNINNTEEGASAVEYAIIASLIAAVIVTIVISVGQKTLTNFMTLAF